jgi:hypothetical protein
MDGRIILKWILKKQGMSIWTKFISGHGSVAGFCEHGNELLGM